MSDELRNGIKRLIGRGLSYQKILNLAQTYGHDIGITQDALRKFYNRAEGELTPLHAEKLLRFFRTAPVAIALLAPDGNVAPQFFSLLAALCAGDAGKASRTLIGTHWLYHGSFLYPDKFVVRAVKIGAVASSSGTEFFDYLSDESDRERTAVYESSGVVIYTNSRAQFVSHNSDNVLGLRLLICEEVFPSRAGVTDTVTARMLGLGNDARPYHRHAMLVRSKEKFVAMKKTTGVFAWKQLTPIQRSSFETLKNRRERISDVVPDPVDNL